MSPSWPKTTPCGRCLIKKSTSLAFVLSAVIPEANCQPGQEFYIIYPDQSRRLERTNRLGCLVWTEEIPFDFTAQSTYIEMRREIVGKGTHKGSASLWFAINPWVQSRQEGSPEFIDLNQGNLEIPLVEKDSIDESDLKSYQGLGGLQSSIPLLIEERPHLNIHKLRDMENGKKIKVIFSAHPFIQPLNLNGDQVPMKLNIGLYKVYAQLVAQHESFVIQQKAEILTPDTPFQIVKSTNNLIRYEATMNLTHQITEGRLQLALKIVPLVDENNNGANELTQIKPFSALYHVGEFSSNL